MNITSSTPYLTRDAVPIPEALKARLPEYESVVARPYFEKYGKNDIGFFLTLNSGRGLKYIGSKSVILMTSDAVTAEALRSIRDSTEVSMMILAWLERSRSLNMADLR